MLPSTFLSSIFLDATLIISFVRKSGAPRFKPGAAGWEVRMLPVCYAALFKFKFCFVESAPVGTYYDRFIYFLPLYDWYLKQTSKQSAHQIYCCCQIKKFWTDSKKNFFLNERIFCNFWIHCSRKMHLLDLLAGCLSANLFWPQSFCPVFNFLFKRPADGVTIVDWSTSKQIITPLILQVLVVLLYMTDCAHFLGTYDNRACNCGPVVAKITLWLLRSCLLVEAKCHSERH